MTSQVAQDETISERLEYLRGEIRAERISYGEIAELQDYGARGLIDEGDVELREWAGLPEFPEEEQVMRLFTVSIDSEDAYEGQLWNDILYVAAESKDFALNMAVAWVREHRTMAEIQTVEGPHEYKGRAKVLGSFDPNEEN